jgi:putative aldouronate transport system substrate-binding protein
MRKTRIIASALVAALLVSQLAACAPESAPAESAAPAAPATSGDAAPAAEAASSEPLEFTMMANYNGVEVPVDTVMFDHFKNEMNTTIDMTWIPNSAYTDKLNAQIAAADLAQTVVVRSPKAGPVVNADRQGMFWPLDAYLNNPDEYPNFDRFNKTVINNLKIDGQVYAIPRERELVRAGVFWRQDWLENLGLEEPNSIEDLMEMYRAFTQDDPDGNGADDTVGLSLLGDNTRQNVIVMNVWLGGAKNYYFDETDNKIHHAIEQDTFMEAMNFFRDAYANGYIVSDFAVTDSEFLPFEQGRAGAVQTQAIGDAPGEVSKVQELFPDANVGATMEILGPDGELTIQAHAGFTGTLAFPKIQTTTEEELIPILKFWDALGSPENATFMNHGIEGTHYSIDAEGYIVKTEEQTVLFGEVDQFQDVTQFHPYGFQSWVPFPVRQPTELYQKINDSMEEFAPNAVADPCEFMISDVANELGTQMGDMLSDAMIKYILGELDLAGWEAFVTEWRTAGQDEIMAEYTEIYLAENA